MQRTVEQDLVVVDYTTTSQQRISGRMGIPIGVTEVPKISRQESVEVVKSIPQDQMSERSQVIEVPKISCPRYRAGEVPRSSKVSLRSEVLNGRANRARVSK